MNGSDNETRRYTHLPVMPEPVLRLLAPQPGNIVVDGTVGLLLLFY